MKNTIKNILILTVLILLFIKRPFLINSIINGLDIFKTKIFPSIFPIMIISDLLLSSNLITIISNLFGKIFTKVFKVNKYASYVFIMSFFSGCPTNAKYIKDLLNNKVINEKEAIKILSMTMLYNPLLILNISPLNKKDTIYLLIINLLSNILIGIINRNYYIKESNYLIKSKDFNLIESISNSINTLLLILGSIITFISLNSILPIKHPLISGILEITNGIYLIKTVSIYKYKLIFTSILLSFGGLSILYQIKSIFKDTNIDYTLYYKSRIIHLLLMLLLTYIKIII